MLHNLCSHAPVCSTIVLSCLHRGFPCSKLSELAFFPTDVACILHTLLLLPMIAVEYKDHKLCLPNYKRNVILNFSAPGLDGSYKYCLFLHPRFSYDCTQLRSILTLSRQRDYFKVIESLSCKS